MSPTTESLMLGDRTEWYKAVRALAVDRVTAEVVAAFGAAGIRSILLKGPSIARWLYPDGGRTYGDTDLLVPAAAFGRAQSVLGELGFADLFEGWSRFERPIEPPAWTFVRSGAGVVGPGAVDLHHTVHGMAVPDDAVWEAFSANSDSLVVAGVEATVLNTTALALHIVLHAVQHGGHGHTTQDLRRAIDTLPTEMWRPVAELATDLGVRELLGLGLRLDPAGAQVAENLDLPATPAETTTMWSSFAPRGSASLAIVAARQTTRERLRSIRWIILPSPAKTRYIAGLPRGRPWALGGAYIEHWRGMAELLVPALRYVVANRGVGRRFPTGAG